MLKRTKKCKNKKNSLHYLNLNYLMFYIHFNITFILIFILTQIFLLKLIGVMEITIVDGLHQKLEKIFERNSLYGI